MIGVGWTEGDGNELDRRGDRRGLEMGRLLTTTLDWLSPSWSLILSILESLLAFLYLYLVVVPKALFRALKDLALSSLPPIFTRCRGGKCELNDIGLAAGAILIMLIVIWLVKKAGGRREREWLG